MFTLPVKCPYCNEEIIQDWSDEIVSSDIIDTDRGMGDEISHTIDCRGFICPNCSKTFNIEGFVCEYPADCYKYHELKASI